MKWLQPLLTSSPHEVKPKVDRKGAGEKGFSPGKSLFFRQENIFWRPLSEHPLTSYWPDLSHLSALDNHGPRERGWLISTQLNCDHSLGRGLLSS